MLSIAAVGVIFAGGALGQYVTFPNVPLPPHPAVVPACGSGLGVAADCFDDHSRPRACSQWCDDGTHVVVEPCDGGAGSGTCGSTYIPPSVACDCSVLLHNHPFQDYLTHTRCMYDCICDDGDYFAPAAVCGTCAAAGVGPPPGHICVDPHFRTLYGNKPYDFHGLPDQVFNILSTPTSQLNARFISFGHKNDVNMKHHHTFLGEIGFQTGHDQVYIDSATCNAQVNENDITNSQVKTDSMFVMHRMVANGGDGNDDHAGLLQVMTDEWTIDVFCIWRTETVRFFNMDVSYDKLYNNNEDNNEDDIIIPSGVLGQTAEKKDYHAISGAQQGEGIIKGSLFDYKIQENDVFGVQFTYNQFDADNNPASMA